MTYNANNMRHTAADRSQRRIPKMRRINMLLANTFEQFNEQKRTQKTKEKKRID